MFCLKVFRNLLNKYLHKYQIVFEKTRTTLRHFGINFYKELRKNVFNSFTNEKVVILTYTQNF